MVKNSFDNTAEQIADAEHRLVAAQRIGDVEALEKLLHDDLLFIGPSGTVFTKAMDLESHRTGAMIVEKMEPTVEQIHVIGDNAVTIVRSEVAGKVGTSRMDGVIRYIRVWKLDNGSWKVIAGSFTLIG